MVPRNYAGASGKPGGIPAFHTGAETQSLRQLLMCSRGPPLPLLIASHDDVAGSLEPAVPLCDGVEGVIDDALEEDCARGTSALAEKTQTRSTDPEIVCEHPFRAGILREAQTLCRRITDDVSVRVEQVRHGTPI